MGDGDETGGEMGGDILGVIAVAGVRRVVVSGQVVFEVEIGVPSSLGDRGIGVEIADLDTGGSRRDI